MSMVLLTGFDINGSAPGSSSSMTPAPIGSSTPVQTCQNECNISGNYRTGLRIDITGGIGPCFCAPAPLNAPSAAASPAPNSSTFAGAQVQENVPWIFNPGIYSSSGNTVACVRWDCVCTGGTSQGECVSIP